MNNSWQKRQTTTLNCPSGNQVLARRPGPDLALKAGKIAHILKRNDAGTNVDQQLDYIAGLPEAELDQLMAFARVVLVDVIVQPQLSLTPREDQFSPDDVPLNDFWFIFVWAMNGGPTMPVKLEGGEETTVEAVETFPSGQDTGPDLSDHGKQIQ